MTLALVLTLLAAEPKAQLDQALELLRKNDPGAHAALVQAFTIDPELPAPAEPAIEAARAEAVAALKARLAAAAAKVTAAFTAPLPQSAPLDPPKPAEPTPVAEAQPPSVESKPEKERPLVAGGRLTLGAYGFYVIGESRGGPALEASFGAKLGPVRLGGVASFLIGSSLGLTVAARLSTTSQSRVAYLAAVDVGVFYGGSNALFAPFITAHAAGLRLKAGRVGFEIHLASLAVYWLGGSTFRFVPQSGIAVLL